MIERVKFPWVDEGRFDVWMAAYGPKALAVAGRDADGLIMQLADPFIVSWAIETRASSAPRCRTSDVATYSVCVAAPAYVGDDLAHQRDQVRWFGGMVGNHVADIVERYGSESPVPAALTEYIKGRKGYDYRHHGQAGNPDTEFVPDEVIDRFCVLGPVEQHRERLSELAESGVDQFSLYLMHDDPEATIEAYRKEHHRPRVSHRSTRARGDQLRDAARVTPPLRPTLLGDIATRSHSRGRSTRRRRGR